MNLIVGAGRLDRELEGVEELVDDYLTDDGLRYLDYEPSTPSDRLLPDDLAVAILINSRVAARAFKAVQDHGDELRLDALPSVALQETDAHQRDDLASSIAQVASWPGFATSVATKVLHKKRPDLIPILDNEAIFGAYMNPNWPEQQASTDSVYATARIREALDWIWHDLNREENANVWPVLSQRHPKRTKIQLFDMAWWVHFRRIQPVARPVRGERREEGKPPAGPTSPGRRRSRVGFAIGSLLLSVTPRRPADAPSSPRPDPGARPSPSPDGRSRARRTERPP